MLCIGRGRTGPYAAVAEPPGAIHARARGEGLEGQGGGDEADREF